MLFIKDLILIDSFRHQCGIYFFVAGGWELVNKAQLRHHDSRLPLTQMLTSSSEILSHPRQICRRRQKRRSNDNEQKVTWGSRGKTVSLPLRTTYMKSGKCSYFWIPSPFCRHLATDLYYKIQAKLPYFVCFMRTSYKYGPFLSRITQTL